MQNAASSSCLWLRPAIKPQGNHTVASAVFLGKRMSAEHTVQPEARGPRRNVRSSHHCRQPFFPSHSLPPRSPCWLQEHLSRQPFPRAKSLMTTCKLMRATGAHSFEFSQPHGLGAWKGRGAHLESGREMKGDQGSLQQEFWVLKNGSHSGFRGRERTQPSPRLNFLAQNAPKRKEERDKQSQCAPPRSNHAADGTLPSLEHQEMHGVFVGGRGLPGLGLSISTALLGAPQLSKATSAKGVSACSL